MSEIIKKVKKRDGTIVDFDKERITNAIFAAAREVGGRDRRTAERLTDEVVKVLEERFAGQIPSVEDIQDIVEKVLIERGHAKTAKAYILYRKQHEELRKIKSTFLEVGRVVDDYLGMKDWRVRENSNMDYSLSGLLFHIANSVIANYTLDKVYPMEVTVAHTNGDLHIHDLGMGICGYCVKPDTLILGDNKAISEYEPSDRVLGCSHLQRVTEVFERHFSGRLVKIRACGTLPMEVTPEHPILVALKGVSGSHKNESYRWIPASALRPRIERKRVYMVIPRLRGTESDEILDLTPFVKKKSVKVKMLPLSENTAWLLGLYVAEGYSYVGSECRMRFCLGKGETELISRVENTLKGLGLRYRKIHLKTSVHIELRYSALARALKEWCGGNALSKKIPEFILLHERREILEAFLAGYVAGDGSEQKKEKSGKSWYGKRTRMYTASKLLALQLQLLCARLGIFASISRDARESRRIIQGRKVNRRDIFEISFYSRGSKYAHILKDVILTPLRETEEMEYEGPVCNLETEDNTYLVSNMVVHNCAGWSLSQLLAEGFNGVPGKVASKPPAHLDTALLQMSNFIGSLQNEWAGAQAFNCYSEDTEILTDRGWKGFSELDGSELVMTLNPKTGEMEYQKPKKYFVHDYNGKMLHFKSKFIDLLVTPNHRMLIRQRRKGTPKEKCPLILVEASKLRYGKNGRCRHSVPRPGKWRGKNESFFLLPDTLTKIPMKEWMAFLGIYLAEGSLNEGLAKKGHYRVFISQQNKKVRREIEEILRRLPFRYSKDNRGFYIYGKPLYNFLKTCGDSAENKHIPREFLDLEPELLRTFIEWFGKGNGYHNNYGTLCLFTTSTQLRDNLIEMIFKGGYFASTFIWNRKGTSSHIQSRKITVKNDVWGIVVHNPKKDLVLRKPKEVEYKGKVYCVEVPNHVVLVKRNGKAIWSGNSVDTLLAPFVRKDGLSYNQVKQAIQTFVFNLNIASRWGGQTPFTNITLDLTVPEDYKDKPVIIGGKLGENTYEDYAEEAEMINRAFIEVMMEGDMNGRPFSVDSESLCLIKNSGEMKFVEIGEYIDGLMSSGKPVFIKENNCEVLDVRNKGIVCLGLNGGRLGWQRVNYVVRHPQRTLLKITTSGGFSLKVTPSHSVLVLKNGRIQAYPAKDLKEGDYLVAPSTLPSEERKTLSISLAHEFVKKGKEDGIYINGVKKNGKLYKEKRTSNGKTKYTYRVSTFPLSNVAAELNDMDLTSAQIKLSGSNNSIPNYLPITEQLAEFLGWYCAEGSAEKGKYGGISLGFNLKKEKENAIHVAELIKQVFGFPTTLRIVKKRNLIEVRCHSKLLRRIVTEVFGVGNGTRKRVPDILFELPGAFKKRFLMAYFHGDGYFNANDIIVTSISRKLIYGVSTLLKQLGVSHTVTEYRVKNVQKRRFRIQIWNNQKLNPKDGYVMGSGRIPIRESGLEKIVDKIVQLRPFVLDKIGRRRRNTISTVFSEFGVDLHTQTTVSRDVALKIVDHAQSLGVDVDSSVKELLSGDLMYPMVKKIEEVFSTNGMVYDFSTDSESFVTDQFVVHNTFPIPTYSLTRDFNWDNGISSELFEMTAKYGLPYFQNFINSDLRPSDVRSMCCRLRLDLRELRRNVTGGLFGSGDSTGSVGVVTINMPRLGYLSKDEDEFFDRLDYSMYLAKISLEAKREIVTKNMENGLLPFTKRYLGTLDRHFSTIGLVGMNEALLNLFGFGIATEEGKKFAVKTLKFMLERIRQFQEETGHIYNLEATPAEGVSYRLARIDKKKYPDIITAGEKTPYYTNSTTLPVNSGLDLISALKHQEELQTLYTGGTVFHMFIGESLEDGESCKNLVKKVAHKTRLPYFTVTPTYTICENHGFMPGEYPVCPSCGGSTEVYSRVVGYFRPVRNWNAGKQEEFKQRIEYT